MARKPEPSESSWAGVREAQAAASALPNVGYAVTIDLGDAGNIHPPDKYDVGARLALAAQRVAYGDTATVTSGPTLQKAAVEGNSIRVTFDNAGGGLVIGAPPEHFFTSQKKPPQAPGAELEGFAVAGSDLKYSWAKAKIEGGTVVVTSDKVPNPVSVRYAWADNPAANLYNQEGLPAAPFRTDTVPFTK
jgi:sialate O-acetylesterase